MSIEVQSTAGDLLQIMRTQEEMSKGAIKPSSILDESIAPVSFGDLMKQKVTAVNQEQQVADVMTRAVDTGESDDLVGAMVATQKASLSFAALMQIRNRLTQAFDDVMKMPI